MKSHTRHQLGCLAGSVILVLVGAQCMHDSKRVGLYPASSQIVDVFTCKGLDEEGRWIELTDQFDPETDPYVVVAAQLRPDHRRSWITYELTSPADFVVISETKKYPKETDLGIHFDTDRLMEMGGEGEWVAVVYADGMPLGKATFTLGEKRAEVAGAGRFYVIEEENLISEPVLLPEEPPQEPAPAPEGEETVNTSLSPTPTGPPTEESESAPTVSTPERTRR